MNLQSELDSYLATQVITSDNIGVIRHNLLLPWPSKWNSLVRDETAWRENKSEGKTILPLKIPTQLSIDDTLRLVDLLNIAANGTEQGVINYDQWKAKCFELRDFLVARGYKPLVQWCS